MTKSSLVIFYFGNWDLFGAWCFGFWDFYIYDYIIIGCVDIDNTD